MNQLDRLTVAADRLFISSCKHATENKQVKYQLIRTFYHSTYDELIKHI